MTRSNITATYTKIAEVLQCRSDNHLDMHEMDSNELAVKVQLDKLHIQEHRFLTYASIATMAKRAGLDVDANGIFDIVMGMVKAGKLIPEFLIEDSQGEEEALTEGEDYDSKVDILLGKEELICPMAGTPLPLSALRVYYSYVS